MSIFELPDVGEGLQEAEIVQWHVAAGDHVVADQPLVSIETDKAVVEIPSPRSGHIAALCADVGDIVPVGAPLVEFGDGEAVDAGAIVGELPSDESSGSSHPVTAPRTAARSSSPRQSSRPSSPSSHSTAHPSRARATPPVRLLAKRLGVDLDELTPSGPDGTVTRADVEAASAAATAASWNVEPLRGVRRAMDANMARAHAEVVPATVTEEADVADWAPGTDVMARLVRAVARACELEPALNAAYLGRDVGRRLNDHVDIGIAVDTPDGLFVPVLRDVAHRSADDLRAGIEAMRSDIRARTVPPEHLRGATISLSNFGVFGGVHAALVVVPPQVAIVGAGRARDTVVARDGRPVVRRVLPLSLTFDHRVVMGGEAARFLNALRADLEEAT